jgi:hypothetical protein
MPLSVLSALARLDVDPWSEAAVLAELPGDAARQRLATLIAELPAVANEDPVATAARLVELLPGRTRTHMAWRQAVRDADLLARLRALRVGVVLGALIGFQWIIPSCESARHWDSSSAPTSRTTSPGAPMQRAGH